MDLQPTQADMIGKQLITIDPVQYVTQVYAPFRERLDIAKASADKITSMDVKTKEGMALAIKQRAIFRSIRREAEEARKERKAPILTISKLIDGRYKELETEIAEYEDAFHKPIKDEEDRQMHERVALARAEQAKIDAEEKARRDAEEARLASDRAEIERQRADLEAMQKAAQDKIEADERASRMRIEEQEREARKAREAEEAKLKAERDLLEADRRAAEEVKRKEREAAEAIAKAERDAEEAKQREIQRRQNEIAGAYEMLAMFCKRYGGVGEFAPIVAAIYQFVESRQ